MVRRPIGILRFQRPSRVGAEGSRSIDELECPRSLEVHHAVLSGAALCHRDGAASDRNIAFSTALTGGSRRIQVNRRVGMPQKPGSSSRSSEWSGAVSPRWCGVRSEYCVFNGPHGWEPKDPGQSTSWNAPEAWKFITQF